MSHLTTGEVEQLLERHRLLQPYPVENRERYLPTSDQLKSVISFLRAAETCKYVKGTTLYRGITVPKYVLCVAEWFKEYHPETERWAQTDPTGFKKIYERVVWR